MSRTVIVVIVVAVVLAVVIYFVVSNNKKKKDFAKNYYPNGKPRFDSSGNPLDESGNLIVSDDDSTELNNETIDPSSDIDYQQTLPIRGE